MLKKAIKAAALCLLLGCLSACSTSPQSTIDPAAIEADLTTVPEIPTAGSPINLKAEFTGGELSKSSEMAFEIRVNDGSVLLNADKDDQNAFVGTYTFPKSGTYEVYLHLYDEDIHLTKKKKVEVQ